MLAGWGNPNVTPQHNVSSVAVLLAEALVRHADGHELELADNPLTRTMGFRDLATGEVFTVGLTTARQTSQELSERIRDLMHTVEGREHLLLLAPVDAGRIPVIETTRPLLGESVSDACALIEKLDRQAVRLDIHPNDLAELARDPSVGIDETTDGHRNLWGMHVVVTKLRRQGSILITGDGHSKPQVVVQVQSLNQGVETSSEGSNSTA